MRPIPRIAVFADFDDTLTTVNVAQYLLKRFAPESFERISTSYRAGGMTFRQYQERCFDAIGVTVEEMQKDAAENIELRDGAQQLRQAIEMVGGTLTIASAGLDIYIDPVLKSNGMGELNVVCGSAEREEPGTGPFRYDYPFADQDGDPCKGDWATCKCKALKAAGEEAITVFVGDGSTSDACAANRADHVFARDRLLRICEEKGIAATPFEEFGLVTDAITKLADSAGVQPDLR